MKILNDLYIIGAGGFGREVAWLVERINNLKPTWCLKGFIDDNEATHGTVQDGYPVLGGCDLLMDLSSKAWVVCAVGSSQIRKKIIEKIKQFKNIEFATLLDPSVICSNRVHIGDGSIICAGTIITVDISIGEQVIINLDCTIGHDAKINDYVTINPSTNISGNVVIEECVEIGTGTHIIQGKRVGQESVIGAGAIVIKDISEKCVAVGSPAKEIKAIG